MIDSKPHLRLSSVVSMWESKIFCNSSPMPRIFSSLAITSYTPPGNGETTTILVQEVFTGLLSLFNNEYYPIWFKKSKTRTPAGR
ncbi:unnamed protein product, partial [Dovyalis caffra]